MKPPARLLPLLLCAWLVAGCGGGPQAEKPDLLTQSARLGAQGSAWYQKGCYDRAKANFAQSLAAARLVDDLPAMLRARINLGAVALAQGRLNEAALHLDRALFLNREVKDPAEEAQIAGNLAALAFKQGDNKKAELLWNQALELARRDPGPAGLSLHLGNLGMLQRRLGRLAEAEKTLTEALTAAKDQGAPQAGINLQLGLLYQAQGKPDLAQSRLNAALDLDRKAANAAGIAADLIALGSLDLEQARYTSAELYLDRALRLWLELGDRKQADKAFELLHQSHAGGRCPPSMEPYRRLMENAPPGPSPLICQ